MTDEITQPNDELPDGSSDQFDRDDQQVQVQVKDRLLAEPVTDWDHKVAEHYDGRGGP
jgi:hypothetical protein